MDLLELSDDKTISLGYKYYKDGRVSNISRIDDNHYESTVKGRDENVYSVKLDFENINNCSCSCPCAYNKNIACKHMIATYFNIHEDKAEEYHSTTVDKKKEKKIILDRLSDCLDLMNKAELREKLYQVLTLGPDWQLQSFLFDNENEEEYDYEDDEEDDEVLSDDIDDIGFEVEEDFDW